MKVQSWFVGVFLVSAALTAALTGALSVKAEPPGLEVQINQFVHDYEQWQGKKSHDQMALQSEMDSRKKLALELKRIFEPGSMDRNSVTLAQRIADASNGESGLETLLGRMRVIGRDTSRKNPQQYQEIVSAMVADYYVHPERRDAIYFLLSSVSGAVQPQLHRGIDPAIESAIAGWGMALTGLVVWDMAAVSHWGTRVGMIESSKRAWNARGNAYESMKQGASGLLQRIRGQKSRYSGLADDAHNGMALEGFKHGAAEQAMTLLSQERSAGGRIPDWKSILGKLGFSWSRLKESIKAMPLSSQAIAAGAWRQVVQELGRVGQAVVLGGLPGYAWGLSETPKLSKIDPLEILRPYQAIAVLDAHRQAMKLAEVVDAELKDAFLEGPEGTLPDEREIRRNKGHYQAILKNRMENGFVAKDGTVVPSLKDQIKAFEHFSIAAKEFSGNHPTPEISRKVEEYKKKDYWHQRWPKNEDERIAAFAARSAELTRLAKMIEGRATADAKKLGIQGETRLHLSLDLVDIRLGAIRFKLQELERHLKK